MKHATESSILLSRFVAKVRERGSNLSQVAFELGIKYSTLYFLVNYRKKSVPSKRPGFGYEVGKKLEQYVKGTTNKIHIIK